MKKAIVLLCSLVLITSAWSQQPQNFIPVNFKSIAEDVKAHPTEIDTLITAVAQLDSTKSVNDIARAYFCTSYLPNFFKAQKLEDGLYKLLKAKNYEKLLNKADEALKLNPLNCTALTLATIACDKLEKSDATRHLYSQRLANILHAISRTGDGSKEHPFYVTTVADEYQLMRQWFNIWKIKMQMMAGKCDVIELAETSSMYKEKVMYFDTSRVTEVEMELYKK